MVQALVELDDQTNKALNVVKARYSLRDKAAAIRFVVEHYVDTQEPSLRPEFVEKLKIIGKQPSKRIDDLASYYEAKHVRSSHTSRTRKSAR